MQLLFDFFPVLLFFIAYKLAGIYTATAVAIGASLIQVGWVWLRRRQVENMHLATLALLVVFGGLTIVLRDPIFVMWKPTLVEWLFAGVFFGSQFIGQRNLIERTMGHAMTLPPAIWRRLNLAWVLFFLMLGAINLLVVYVWSGFYDAHQMLLAATGGQAVDLGQCAAMAAGHVKTLCQEAHASENLWVNFKLFGIMGLTIVFVLAQALYLSRHVIDQPDTTENT